MAEYKNLQGLRTKTISVFTSSATTKFRLQNNNELGLPQGAIIVALQARNPSNPDGRTPTGRLMVNSTVWDNSYLFLKVKDENSIIDLLTQAYYMPDLTDSALFLKPSNSCNIDWNESYIQINERALPSVNLLESFEIMVHYIMNCEQEVLPNRFSFRTGNKEIGTKRARFEFVLSPSLQVYNLSNTENIGLPLDAVLIGFRTNQPAQPLRNGVVVSNAIESTFLTLKKGTESIVDAYPFAAVVNVGNLIISLDYFPIEPILVNQLDWNSSFFQILNNSLVVAGEILSLELIWSKT